MLDLCVQTLLGRLVAAGGVGERLGQAPLLGGCLAQRAERPGGLEHPSADKATRNDLTQHGLGRAETT
jgi:hypothetical protein